ncbi:MAG: glutamate--cysteine ligase [Gammaproteobacteria bacterium]|nr:glutamate--cysteine ligase [Gammaproteobacteria bacterium]
MFTLAQQRLSRLINSGHSALLKQCIVGLEKESLRVTHDGHLAQTAHPVALGSALTHPYITTDYSEALLEFITPPRNNIAELLQFLHETHLFTYTKIGDEMLWTTSMPCVVSGEQQIPIARYGSSNQGMMKTIYRRGLGHRYGRPMQIIAGAHFNFSFADAFWPCYQASEKATQPLQEFISSSYFSLIRNVRRYSWLILYLFGASPAVCKSFLQGRESGLDEFDSHTLFGPYATSLRMGDIGYTNELAADMGVSACYNSLPSYVESLITATTTSYPAYEKIGVVTNGEYRQLNTNILQIENEYYSSIRPKQLLQENEKPARALQRRGVKYVELRALDINMREPLGINESQLRFLHAFMAFCQLDDSPTIDSDECREIDANFKRVAHEGRKPGLQLAQNGRTRDLKRWGLELCAAMQGICEVLDSDEPGTPYQDTLAQQQALFRDAGLTPSAIMLDEMRTNNEAFFHYGLRLSQQHRNHFAAQTLSAASRGYFEDEARRSLQHQQRIEADDEVPFATHLQRYFNG